MSAKKKKVRVKYTEPQTFQQKVQSYVKRNKRLVILVALWIVFSMSLLIAHHRYWREAYQRTGVGYAFQGWW